MKSYLLLLLLISFQVLSQENFSFNGDRDTAQFETVYRDFEANRSVLNKKILSNYQILFVQGLATNITHELGRFIGPVISKQDGFLSPFFQQKRLFDKLGIASSFVKINPNGGCEKNGDAIANAILAAWALNQKKVILITQSKAGPDALHGLVGNYLAVSKMAGWLAYQPPHHGTYLADAPSQGRAGSKFVDITFKLLKGSGLAVKDMRTDFRRNYMRENAESIQRIVESFPIVSLVTDDVPLKSLREYLLLPFRGQSKTVSFLSPFVAPISKHGGGINDGIAMVDGTCIDGGTTCVYLHGIDHFAAVMNTSPYKTLTEKERLLTFQSLLQTLIQHLK